jgi:microcystin degradation protein MlrC
MPEIKIAIAGLMHESNSFAPGMTTLNDFEIGGIDTGPSIPLRWADAQHELGGFFAASQIYQFKPLPAFTAWAMPSSIIKKSTYETLLDRLIAGLRVAGDCDGVLLALHGSMMVEAMNQSADAHTAKKVREEIGPDRPLVVTLDFHANICPELAKYADAMIVYQTYPHIDQRSRGQRAGKIITQALRTRIKPVSVIKPVPILIHLLAQNTNREPVASILNFADEIISTTPGLLELQFVAGFPYADSPSTGATIVAVAESNLEIAQSAAQKLFDRVWDERENLTGQPPAAEFAVAQAILEENWPTILVDIGDNVGGGSAADSTVIAHEIIRQNGPGFWVVLHDEPSVTDCIQAGVGHRVRIQAGGKVDQNAPPLDINGRVKLIHDGRYEETEARHGGVKFHDQGLTAVIETDRGDTIICNSNRHAPFSLGQLTSLGLDPSRSQIIIVKAAVAFRAAYEPIANSILEVDTPGLTAGNPKRFQYANIRRPILPLDQITS